MCKISVYPVEPDNDNMFSVCAHMEAHAKICNICTSNVKKTPKKINYILSLINEVDCSGNYDFCLCVCVHACTLPIHR